MTTEPKVSIVVVSWNVRDLLSQNLKQLLALRNEISFEVFVVDNGSVDGTSRMVRDEFSWVHFIQNDFNAGFSRACNQAMRLASGEVIVLLNPDMCVVPGALERTYRELVGDKTIGVLGVKLLDESGAPIGSVRRDPGIWDQIAILLKIPHFFPRVLDRYLAKDVDLHSSQDVEQVRGSFFAFRRELLKSVGMFDERYFLWFEEVDYCRRVRNIGLRVRYCAEVSCKDFVGRSFAQVPLVKKQWMFFRSAFQYFVKWGIRRPQPYAPRLAAPHV